jgi:hypothetical protein
MRIKKLLASVVGACALAFATPGAQAGPLAVNAGWIGDITFGLGSPSLGSDWTFDLPYGGTFSIVDGFLPDDAYTVTDTATLAVVATTAVSLLPYAWTAPSDPLADPYWDDPDFGRMQIVLAPGSYSFSIAAVADILFPAGFYVRVDAPVVPAPAALLLFGAGLAGLVAARRLNRA